MLNCIFAAVMTFPCMDHADAHSMAMPVVQEETASRDLPTERPARPTRTTRWTNPDGTQGAVAVNDND